MLNLAINMVAMHPADITLDSSDEQVFLYLDGFKPGLLPEKVIELNPFDFRPSELYGGNWYIVHSIEQKENEHGFWNVKEEASEVFTNSSIIGWRKTLEYFQLVDYPRRTDWVMQEYQITQKGQCSGNKEKELRAMYRILLSTEMRSKKGAPLPCYQGMNDSPTVSSIAPSIHNSFGKDSTSGSLMKTAVDGTTLLSKDDKFLDPEQRDIPELHSVFSDGDFIEWDDLADPLSHSSSSDNSGRTSMTSEEFDPIALLEALEDSNNQGQQGNRCSSAAIRPIEVVMQPATSRPLVCATATQQPSGSKQASSVIQTMFLDEGSVNRSVKKQKVEHGDEDEDPLFLQALVASSSTTAAATTTTTTTTTTPPIPTGKKEAAMAKTKGLKKYFCFLPF